MKKCLLLVWDFAIHSLCFDGVEIEILLSDFVQQQRG